MGAINSRIPPRTALTSTRPQVPSAKKPVAVFIDGSALYQASKSVAEGSFKLNYRVLVDVLCREIDGLSPSDPLSKGSVWTMWTAASPENSGQSNFLEFVDRELHWEVRKTFPSQSFVVEPSAVLGLGGSDSSRLARLIRFDASIGFAIGRLSESHRIVVVSDSFPLCEPLTRVGAHFAQTTDQPVIAFFGRAMDSRWHLAVGKDDAIKLINLDEHEAELFGMPRKEIEAPTRSVGSLVF